MHTKSKNNAKKILIDIDKDSELCQVNSTRFWIKLDTDIEQVKEQGG